MTKIPMNLPNVLTVGRIVLIPPLMALMLASPLWTMWPALVLYTAIALTDWLDGHLARMLNQKSEFGRFLDPIADKILVAAMFIALASYGTLHGILLAMPIIILTREFLVAGLREYLGPKNIIVHVTKLAKWKTTVQMIAIGFLIGGKVYISAELCGHLLLLLATGLTITTGWQYFKVALPHFKD
ncbi:MAG TPA: CDP-diacylglycerol--glycerol-3-phosphate 3-phosphatidyltransferase [Micavibrio sp.]